MTWVKLDDQFFLRPSMRTVGSPGREMFLAGTCYCSMNLTDGTIVKSALPAIAALAEVSPDIADLLVQVGLWVDHAQSFEVVDYLKFNPSRAQVESDREKARTRYGRTSGEVRAKVPRTSSASSTSPDSVLTSSSVSTVVDDDNLPDGLWIKVAEKRLLLQKSAPESPGPWLKACARNAALEQGVQARAWFGEFDVSVDELASAVASRVLPQSWSYQRRKPKEAS